MYSVLIGILIVLQLHWWQKSRPTYRSPFNSERVTSRASRLFAFAGEERTADDRYTRTCMMYSTVQSCRFFSLNPPRLQEIMYTGRFVFLVGNCHDAHTIRLLQTPRCQMPDIETKWDIESESAEVENLISLVETKPGKPARRRKRRRIRERRLREKRYVLQGIVQLPTCTRTYMYIVHFTRILTWYFLMVNVYFVIFRLQLEVLEVGVEHLSLHRCTVSVRSGARRWSCSCHLGTPLRSPLLPHSPWHRAKPEHFLPTEGARGWVRLRWSQRSVGSRVLPWSGRRGAFRRQWTVDCKPKERQDLSHFSHELCCVFTHKWQTLGYNVFQVAVHEIGHALGLRHSKERNALMAPYYKGYIPIFDFQLHDDDIQGTLMQCMCM